MHTLALHATGNVVRLICVSSSENYWREYEAAYGDIESSFRDWKVYVNCEQWYERLLSDLKFKRFPTMTLDECAKGVWRVSELNSEKCQALHTYLLKQIKLYNDDEPVISIMERFNDNSFEPVENLMDEHGVLQGFAFPKRVHRDGWVIPSWAEWRGMIYRILTHLEWKYGIRFYDKLSRIIEPSNIGIVGCEKTGNIHINKDTIPLEQIPEFLYTFYECIAPERMTFKKLLERLYQSKGFSLYATTCIQGTSEDTVVGIESPSTLAYAFLENETYAAPSSCVWAPVAPKNIPESKPIIDHKLYVYKSIIDPTKCLCWIEPMRDLVDFKLVIEPICETELGFELFNKLNECRFENFKMICADLKNFIETLDALKPSTPTSHKNDHQYIYTQRYVDHCKDNTAETNANTVIASVLSFLQSCISENDINRNRIGQDLIEMGVRKTRKARGFVYGLREPDASYLALLKHLPI
jgi:hypothetical protein